MNKKSLLPLLSQPVERSNIAQGKQSDRALTIASSDWMCDYEDRSGRMKYGVILNSPNPPDASGNNTSCHRFNVPYWNGTVTQNQFTNPNPNWYRSQNDRNPGGSAYRNSWW